MIENPGNLGSYDSISHLAPGGAKGTRPQKSPRPPETGTEAPPDRADLSTVSYSTSDSMGVSRDLDNASYSLYPAGEKTFTVNTTSIDGSYYYSPGEDPAPFRNGNPVEIDPFEPTSNVRGTAYEEPPEEKEWTVLMYMAGDNDLEPYLVNNLKSLEKVGSGSNINIAVELDRGDAPRSPVSRWKGSRRFLVQKSDDPRKITSKPVQDLGKVNMADPEHLSDFIQWGMKNYPARHYMVLINDHGYGFMGIADDKGNKHSMNLTELGKAFDTATRDTVTGGVKDAVDKTGKKIDIIGFDACLMAQAEVAYELKDYADIMIGSQEVIGSGGWPYDDIGNSDSQIFKGPEGSQAPPDVAKGPGPSMSPAPSMSPRGYNPYIGLSDFLALAEKIITRKGALNPETFAHGIVTYCERHPETTPTMSAVRLGEFAEKLADSMKTLASAIDEYPDKAALLDIVNSTQQFNLQSPEQSPYGDYRDIHHFCQNIIDSGTLKDEKLKEAAKGVQKALKAMLLDVTDSKKLPPKYKDAHGVSAYLPDTVGSTDFGYKQTKFDKRTGWYDSLSKLASYDPEQKWETLYEPPKVKMNRPEPPEVEKA
ncbi:MAG: clostripain-related cysteine peptidase [Candidatus Eremiobacteraeota bacterium]|nr:clostripain-related cysteine peptidase [Candidatus Eremiobacteraeota bacterium]